MTTDPQSQVRELLKSIETGDPGPATVLHPQHYRQHNLAIADGIAGLAELLQSLPPGATRVRTARVLRDGDFVFAHTDYDFFGPKIGFDIFRFDQGRIVEHWDNLQVKPAQPNPSGRSMIDGSTAVIDLDKTDTNKALVRAFIDEVLVGGRMHRLGEFIDDNHYLQHNPAVADGLDGLRAALDAMARSGVSMKYDRVHKVLGEGNFVLAVSEGQFAGQHVAFYDLFRVAAGRLVEHWDTIEAIPPRADWKNPNGKFGF